VVEEEEEEEKMRGVEKACARILKRGRGCRKVEGKRHVRETEEDIKEMQRSRKQV
jgi:hypothetical protein